MDNQVTWEGADTSPGPTATIGVDIYFRFLVTNTSNVSLNQISLTDPSYDLSGCTIPSTLDPGDFFECVIGPLAAAAGTQTNTAEASGNHNGTPATASDDANYYGGNLSIALEKSVSVDGGTTYHEADAEPGPSATVGEGVTFKFVVTNTSNVALSNITLDDSDFDLSGCTITDPLAAGASFECEIGPFDAITGQHTNTATASGDYAGQTATAMDLAHYFGAAISIDLEKSVSVDGISYVPADEAPGPELLAGGSVWFKFVVTNTSNVPLSNISLTDPSYDLSGCSLTDPLAAGSSFECVIGPLSAATGPQENTAEASGDYGGDTATASDTAHYYGAAPAIDVEKLVSVDGGTIYHDADAAPGETVPTNGAVFYRFVVTNSGNVALSGLTLTDPSYDLSGCTLVDPLAAGGSFACTIGPFNANFGLHTNTANASGQFGGQTYSDSDPANYTGVSAGTPSIDLEKFVSVDGGVTYLAADDTPGPTAFVPGTVYFRFLVTNTGNVELSGLSLTDPSYDLSGCTLTDPLAAGDSFFCVIGPLDAASGQQTNTATASGDYGLETASASDPAHYFGGVGAIDVEKFVSFDGGTTYDDADGAPGPTVMAGDEATFKFVVTNIGTVSLYNVAVTDTVYDTLDCSDPGPLAPGHSFECVIGPYDIILDPEDVPLNHLDTATATGHYGDRTATDQDSVYYAAYYWAFTPGFWKNNTKDKGKNSHDAWKYTGYDTSDLLGSVFDADCLDDYRLKRKTFDEYSLLAALGFRGGEDVQGAMEILLRAAVASLLNASFHELMGNEIGEGGVYPYTSAEVIAMVNEAICSGDRTTMLELYVQLDAINNGIHYIDWSWPAP